MKATRTGITGITGIAILGFGATVLMANVKTPQGVLWKLHHTNEMEIKAGQLAQSKSGNGAVKQYADTLIADHQASEQRVQSVATSQSVDLTQMPSEIDSDKQKKMADEETKMDKLGSLSGVDFDKAFLKQMIEGHTKVIDKLKLAQKDLPDGEVKSLVNETLPTIEKHKSMAESIKKTISKS